MTDALFIVNPISGKSSGRKQRIIKALQKAGCEIVYTQYAGHAEILAREATQKTVVAVGGDGTVNEVARGLYGSAKTMGIIPCGSGNGLANHLNIKGKTSKLLDIIEHGQPTAVNCWTIDGRPFFSVSGVGLDAIVSERFATAGTRGLSTYIKEAVKTWRHFKPAHYILKIDGTTIETDAVFITCANSNQWGNEARIANLASINDGLLDIVVMEMFHTWEIPHLVWLLMTGRANRCRHIKYLKGKQIDILRTEAGPAHFDGDYFRCEAEVQLRRLDHDLKILTPAKQ